MKRYPLEIFQDYSFLSDETIFKNIINKLNKKNRYITAKELPKLLKYIDIKDINQTISKLETNLTIIDHVLEDKDNELLYHLKALNQQNLKLISELYIMLENRELKNL